MKEISHSDARGVRHVSVLGREYDGNGSVTISRAASIAAASVLVIAFALIGFAVLIAPKPQITEQTIVSMAQIHADTVKEIGKQRDPVIIQPKQEQVDHKFYWMVIGLLVIIIIALISRR